jgi:hypothetical protein
MHLSGKKGVTLVAMLIVLASLLAAGCGSNQAQEPALVSEEGLKLPPGVVEQGGLPADAPERVVQEKTTTTTTSTANAKASASVTSTTLDLEGGRFTLTKVTRMTDNKDVTSAAMREMKGDYLEFELTVENTSDDLLNLGEFEFRVWSPGIDTDDYAWNYPLGKPNGDNLIAATLLDQDNLTPVTLSLKIGEVFEKSILFFDLNPKSVRRNDAFDPEGATFSIYKARGDGAGEKTEVSLSGLVKEG